MLFRGAGFARLAGEDETTAQTALLMNKTRDKIAGDNFIVFPP